MIIPKFKFTIHWVSIMKSVFLFQQPVWYCLQPWGPIHTWWEVCCQFHITPATHLHWQITSCHMQSLMSVPPTPPPPSPPILSAASPEVCQGSNPTQFTAHMVCPLHYNSFSFNTLRPRQNGRVANDIYKCNFFNEVWILIWLISQHWSMWWLGAEPATNHSLPETMLPNIHNAVLHH